MTKQQKITYLIVLGNILEYYDFLLFAHLGFIITPLFFPNQDSTSNHILSLILFGLSFIIRPIGGFIFGLIADIQGRKAALVTSMKWAIFPALGIAFLPTYNQIGIIGTCIFIFLRIFQGIALGGEYPIAGTYLMEEKKQNLGFLSSILVASGSVGSLIGLGIATLCIKENSPEWLWRAAFLIGGVGTFVSYRMRNYLREYYLPKASYTKQITEVKNLNFKRFLVVMIGLLIGLTVWLPMTYSNFYLTKILELKAETGLYASFIALVVYISILPVIGYIYDRVDKDKYIILAAFLVFPLSIVSCYLLTKNHITIAQTGLVIAAALIGAPVHVIMNSLFPKNIRGRNIGILFMIGLSFGGMFPSIAGYLVNKTRLDIAPALLTSIIALIACFCFYVYKELKKEELKA